jgi:hypothetical protein
LKLLLSTLLKTGGIATVKVGYKALTRIPDEKELGGSALDQDRNLPVVQSEKPYLSSGRFLEIKFVTAVFQHYLITKICD